ncbi:hypothetical protein [Paraflavitalea speifideaquila]|uniref:hypothetical protein n=1 Tax=Paraflavitalea speifideaquila TaxID=3076558 RepID=UPI0028E5998F|nr:hypothetical protein [Paraflavitalea speifideiaquila]
MENTSNQESNLFNISIEGNARSLLVTAATWARIVAIIGFISAGISLLEAIFGNPIESAAAKTGSVLFLMIFIAIGVIINIFLFRFATNTLASLNGMNQIQFNEGVNNLRTYFKIMGILIIIVLALCIVFFLFMGIGLGLRG